ncbi:FAD/NAD(P)-binding domain-containing protein [Saccharata proteae CBS 121410]|uniref:FAD/NAD(P)-binding domain-containing protein n=1 Tax=Saccharata proteae CBS 121410 TaxID=1314787 RepID=A0A9P4HPC8_9PEZI|nr:FAD/NAD(P)-binding domain-containing protein [Saccharata proteae CBS 121410]
MSAEVYVPDARDGQLPPKTEYAPLTNGLKPTPTTNGVGKDHDDVALGEEHGRTPRFELEDHPIDESRSLKVAVIGAGLCGILAGALLPIKVPGIQLTIFEKNHDVGGTWLENTYPGVRCDIPSTVYQSSFEPNTKWTEEFARGDEIRDYWQSLARKYGVYSHMRFKTPVRRCEWNATLSQWAVTIEDLSTGHTTTEHFDFVCPAIGRFNDWKLPSYPGIETFKGLLRHSSNWDPTFDPRDKSVAVIGNGASGIQVVPELQPVVKKLDHYARSRTWIAGSLGGRERKAGSMPFSAQQIKDFEDPAKYLSYRKTLEETYWRKFGSVFKDSADSQNAKENFRQLMAQRLKDKPELVDALVPDFSPHCRRLTPGPGYLEALTEENVEFIQTPIKRFTEDGIETVDGKHRPVDAVICSTGANISNAPPFPIVAGEFNLARDWEPEGKFGHPYNYLGLGVPGFPNMLFIYGPNSAAVAGTIPHSAENQITYIARLLRKVSRQGIRTAMPSKAATDDFVEYMDAFFPKTVFSENCRSWYNGGRAGARIHGVWPGSGTHLNMARREPRWEDWEWTLLNDPTEQQDDGVDGMEKLRRKGNRFAWLGNGTTRKEKDQESDLLSWLRKPEDIDLRDYHEQWWDV